MAGSRDHSQHVVVGASGYSFSRYVPASKPQPETTTPATRTVTRFDNGTSVASAKRKRSEDTTGVSSVRDVNKAKKLKAKTENGAEPVQLSETGPSDEGEGKKARATRRGKRRRSSKIVTDDVRPEADDVTKKEEERPEKMAEVDEPLSKPKRSSSVKLKKDSKSSPDTGEEEKEATPIRMSKAPIQDQGDSPKEKSKKKRKDTRKDEDTTMLENGTDEGDTKEERHKMILDRKEKSLRLAEEAAKKLEDQDETNTEEPGEFHELGPLPQPAPLPVIEPQLTYETLPSWLAAPIRVAHSKKTSFAELGILPKAAKVLQEKGYRDAFAVQTAAIPLLMPTSRQKTGDVLISAATGSGKTLAYALPIVRDISQGCVTRLRALVVLPTRELVKQAQEVFDLCIKAYEGGDRKRVKVGTAVGSHTLKSEQESLVESCRRYDTSEYNRLINDLTQLEKGGNMVEAAPNRFNSKLGPWEGEVVDYSSKVDVLICTPGRLVEHIEQTPGFNLDYIRWLIVDEADKLLAQSFQGWLDVILEKFGKRRFTARESPDMDLDGVRKVILSATLTRDLGLLSQLALRRPQLIVLESDSSSVDIAEHHLPIQLEEFAIRVYDADHRPLYLLGLIRSEHMRGETQKLEEASLRAHGVDSDTSDSSDSSDSSDTSDTSDTSSDESSAKISPRKGMPLYNGTLPTMLVFTKSNETALRLSRLLMLLDPSLGPHISTLTSTTPTHVRRKTLKAFSSRSSPVRLIIASDLVARGIDIPSLDHVINYDLPPSVAGYVHRVGRTARAGRSGRAWTLVDDGESGWFWGRIAKSAAIRRAQKVGRVVFERMDDGKVQEYEAALERLGQEALAPRRKR